ncbi:MAG: hypothetical protein JSV63_00460, partial [Candidatus Aenigmatarchaeota archaeon]
MITMAEEKENTDSDVLKSIKDKLAELEDLQLVNKLDIINVKNELDKASLTGFPRPEAAGKEKELEEKAEDLKKAEKLVKDLEVLKASLSKAPPADTSKVQADLGAITSEMEALKMKVGTLEKAGPPAPPKVDESVINELKKRIDQLEAAKPPEIEADVPAAIRDQLSGIRQKLSDLEKLPRETPSDVIQKIDKIEKISAEMETLKSQLKEQTLKSAEMAAKAPAGAPDDLLERVKMLEAAVAADARKQPPKEGEKPATEVLDRIDKLEQKVSGLDVAKAAAVKGKERPEREASKNVEEIENMLTSIKETVLNQGKDIADLKDAKGAAATQLKLDDVKKELDSIKSNIGEIEDKSAKIGMAPDALEELKKFKGQFPVEEYHEIKKKMTAIEKKMQDLAVLASGLKPIRLPGEGKEEELLNQLKARIKELEKVAPDVVKIDMFRELEKRIEQTREWLPKHISDNTSKKIEEFRKELKNKMGEVLEIKEDIVNHTIDQLLAQPGHVNRLVGDAIKKEIEGISTRVSKMDSAIKPSDAKLTALLRDVEQAQKDLEKAREDLKKTHETS